MVKKLTYEKDAEETEKENWRSKFQTSEKKLTSSNNQITALQKLLHNAKKANKEHSRYLDSKKRKLNPNLEKSVNNNRRL